MIKRQRVNWLRIKTQTLKNITGKNVAFCGIIYGYECSEVENITVSKNSHTATAAVKFCLRVLFIWVIFFMAYGQLNSFIIRADDKDNFVEMIHHSY